MSKSTLRLGRLLILRGSKHVYDQEFHPGVNIIRGWNSTGKSTIMDFLVYVLGYEIVSWTEEQLLCSSVIAEIFINGVQVCLKRDISETGQAPTLIFEGDYDAGSKDSENWLRYSSRRSAERHSFSQQMFDMLDLPTHKNDDDANLTMHQILRLLYVDQLTSTSKLLKADDQHDNATIRRAIGEYLLGIDDLESHNIRQDLMVANKIFEEINGELKAIYRMFGNDASSINREVLSGEISEVNNTIDLLIAKRSDIQASTHEKLDEAAERKTAELVNEISRLNAEIDNLQDVRRSTNIELLDTKHFLDSLQYRLSSLNESKLVNGSLGGISFKYCPSCLTEIAVDTEGHSCGLCKADIGDKERDFAYIQMMNEINFQIKESLFLVEDFQNTVDVCNSKIPAFRRQLSILKEEYNDLVSFTDNRSALIAEVSTEIGYQKSMVETLEEKLEFVEKVEGLQRKKAGAQGEITALEDRLEALKAKNKNRFETVYKEIEGISSKLLVADGGEQSFKEPEYVFFDFAKDSMAVNGRSKFSASSMVILKNSLRFAFFLQALQDKDSRIPNFLIMDNIEDKGMVAKRSQNFQHLIIDACKDVTADYQLIFTTSMIAEDLNDTPYCVGPYYPEGSYTLNLTN
ncbi:ATP-binding protein [Teredinibacter turnerae]|uniref:ATP-binding protein n=1 Tax=Teredinibacter turnerae TaxID=2426 RepID=UPI00041653CB|nr:ATP-binding protein [Teredinibacter turnerae]